MKRYYKDRDFPEVKVSNGDIVAIIKNTKQLERVIKEHNDLLDMVQDSENRIKRYKEEVEHYRQERDDLRYLLNCVNERVMPGTADSADCLREIIRERDKYKVALEKILEVEINTESLPRIERVYRIAREALK